MARCSTKPRVRSDASTPSDSGVKFTAEVVEKLSSDPRVMTQKEILHVEWNETALDDSTHVTPTEKARDPNF